MSHFSVMVRVSGRVKAEWLERAVGKLLDPYCEHTDKDRLKKYFVFMDEEDDHLNSYNTESTEMIRLDDGALVMPWDERFRVKPGGIGTHTHNPPEHLERVQVPFRERFSSFMEYMKEWHGNDERDEEMKRFGYWDNPQGKWDYYRIGGRWRGTLKVLDPSFDNKLGEVGYEWKYEKKTPGDQFNVDVCRIRNLNHIGINEESRKRTDEFFAEMDAMFSGKKFGFDEGPRSTMLALGVLDCKNKDELTGGEYWKEVWQHDPNRFDVIAKKPMVSELEPMMLSHLNPIRPWAYVDVNGWFEKGKMGWFGCGSDTPNSNVKHAQTFEKWLSDGNKNDWIVMTDCHV